MNDEIIEVAVSDIQIERRFRKDHGDVDALARLIEEGDLLQPIGVTVDLRLVFGERRLRAYRDVLKRDTIPARIVNPASVELAQIDENVGRKDFTISEKVEIVGFLRGYRHGGDRRSKQARNSRVENMTVEEAVSRAGFKSVDAYSRANRVVENGVPELVKAMDSEEISVSAAAELASLDEQEQCRLLATKRDWTAAEINQIKQRPTKTIVGGAPQPSKGPSNPEVVEPAAPTGTLPVEQRDGDLGDDKQRPDEQAQVGKENDPYNFYPTPAAVTEALLEVEDFGSEVWEPACGGGAISEVLVRHGYEVVSSDIVDRGYGEVEDFFESDRTAECVITNPDFDYSEEFVRTALAKTSYKVAMLLPLTFLTSRGRYELLSSSPLKAVYVFTGRVSLFPREVRTSGGNGRENNAWFVWEHGYQGSPTIHLFPPDVCDVAEEGKEPPRPKHQPAMA